MAKKKSSISYTAVVLDDKSRNYLISLFKVPDNWEVKGDHMTINLGEAKPEMKSRLGEGVSLLVTGAAMDYGIGVLAVRVDTDIPSKNDVKHITIAINRAGGATPKDSNKLDLWYNMPLRTEPLSGTIVEVPFKN